jgi:hypothetical protein
MAERAGAIGGGAVRLAGHRASARLRGKILWLLTAATLVASAYEVLAALRPAEDSPHVVRATVGGVKFAVLSSFLRSAALSDGPAPTLEAALLLPSFAPAGDFEDVTGATDLDERLAKTVVVIVRPADPSLDPADRTALLYERFLVEDAWSHPGGLVARAFADDSPFRGDELYFTAPEGREFAARCRQPDPTAWTQNTCLAEARMGDVDVEIRFAAAHLSEWRALLAGVRSFVASARR